MSIKSKASGYKTKALASSKRVPQLFSALVSSYAVVFRDGARHTCNASNEILQNIIYFDKPLWRALSRNTTA